MRKILSRRWLSWFFLVPLPRRARNPFPEGPTIKKIQSRSKVSTAIEIFNLARNFQSRRLEFPTKNTAAVGGSLEIFILARKFQSRSKSRIFWSLGPLGLQTLRSFPGRVENSPAPYKALRALRARSPPRSARESVPETQGVPGSVWGSAPGILWAPSPNVSKKWLKSVCLDTFKSLLEGPQGHFSRHFRAHPDFWRHSLEHSCRGPASSQRERPFLTAVEGQWCPNSKLLQMPGWLCKVGLFLHLQIEKDPAVLKILRRINSRSPY